MFNTKVLLLTGTSKMSANHQHSYDEISLPAAHILWMIKTTTVWFGLVTLEMSCVFRRDLLHRNEAWKALQKFSRMLLICRGNYFAIPRKGRSSKVFKQKKMAPLLEGIPKTDIFFSNFFSLKCRNPQKFWLSIWKEFHLTHRLWRSLPAEGR